MGRKSKTPIRMLYSQITPTIPVQLCTFLISVTKKDSVYNRIFSLHNPTYAGYITLFY